MAHPPDGSKSGRSPILVAVRLRPLPPESSSLQYTTGGTRTKETDEGWTQLTVQKPKASVTAHDVTPRGVEQRTYRVNHVFDTSASQADVSNFLWPDVEQNIFTGFNATVLCYGQTGSGKTYTLTHDGVVQHLCRGIFRRIGGRSSLQYRCSISACEVYMDSVYDLAPSIPPGDRKLAAKATGSVYTAAERLTTIPVRTLDEVLQVFEECCLHRRTSAHELNTDSSRSHLLFFFHLRRHAPQGKHEWAAKLTIADLAGSERVAKTKSTGMVFKEAIGINSSLTALGDVMLALAEHRHVVFRRNPLTMMLRDSLVNSYFSLICCCSTRSADLSETLNTLQFASVAQKVEITRKRNIVSGRGRKSSLVDDEPIGEEAKAVMVSVGVQWEEDEEEIIEEIPQLRISELEQLVQQLEEEKEAEVAQEGEANRVLSAHLEERDLEVTKLRADLDALMGERRELVTQVENVNEMMEEGVQKRESLRAEVKERDNKITAANAEIFQLMVKLSHVNGEKEAEADVCRELRSAIASHNQTLKILRRQKAQFEAEVKDALWQKEQEESTTHDLIGILKEQIQGLETVIVQKARQLTETEELRERELNQAEQAMDTLRESEARVRDEERASRWEQDRQYKGEIDAQRWALKDQAARIQEHECLVRRRTMEMQQQKAELEALLRAQEDVAAQTQNRLVSELAAKENVVEDLEAQLYAAQCELQDLSEKWEEDVVTWGRGPDTMDADTQMAPAGLQEGDVWRQEEGYLNAVEAFTHDTAQYLKHLEVPPSAPTTATPVRSGGKSEAQRLRTAHRATLKELELMRKQLAALRQRQANHQCSAPARDEFRNRAQFLNKQLLEQRRALRKEIQTVTKQLGKTNRLQSKREREKYSLQNTLAVTTRKQKRLQEAVTVKTSEVAALQKQLRTTIRQKHRVMHSLSRSEGDLERTHREKQISEHRLGHLLTVNSNENQRLKRELEEIRHENSTLTRHLVHTQREVEGLQNYAKVVMMEGGSRRRPPCTFGSAVGVGWEGSPTASHRSRSGPVPAPNSHRSQSSSNGLPPRSGGRGPTSHRSTPSTGTSTPTSRCPSTPAASDPSPRSTSTRRRRGSLPTPETTLEASLAWSTPPPSVPIVEVSLPTSSPRSSRRDSTSSRGSSTPSPYPTSTERSGPAKFIPSSSSSPSPSSSAVVPGLYVVRGPEPNDVVLRCEYLDGCR